MPRKRPGKRNGRNERKKRNVSRKRRVVFASRLNTKIASWLFLNVLRWSQAIATSDLDKLKAKSGLDPFAGLTSCVRRLNLLHRRMDTNQRSSTGSAHCIDEDITSGRIAARHERLVPLINGSVKRSKNHGEQYPPFWYDRFRSSIQCTNQQDSENEVFTPVSELADHGTGARRKKCGRSTGVGKIVSRQD